MSDERRIDIALNPLAFHGLRQTLALCRVTTPDAAVWGPPLIYHVGDPGDFNHDSDDVPLRHDGSVPSKKPFLTVTYPVRTLRRF